MRERIAAGKPPSIWEGPVKSIFWMDGTVAEELPNGPSGPRRFCGVRGFAGGKTSAEGWLCHPEHLNHRRAERALGPRSPKRKTRYKRVFLFGGGGESRIIPSPSFTVKYRIKSGRFPLIRYIPYHVVKGVKGKLKGKLLMASIL